MKKKQIKDLMVSSILAHENAQEMILDAFALYDADRFARAKALYILSAEEFAKSKVLMDCAAGKRVWTRNQWKKMMNHTSKLVIANSSMIKQALGMKHRPRFEDWGKFKNFEELDEHTTKIEQKLDVVGKDMERKYNSKKLKPKVNFSDEKNNALYIKVNIEGRTEQTPFCSKEDIKGAIALAILNMTEATNILREIARSAVDVFGSVDSFREAIDQASPRSEDSLTRIIFDPNFLEGYISEAKPVIEEHMKSIWPETDAAEKPMPIVSSRT